MPSSLGQGHDPSASLQQESVCEMCMQTAAKSPPKHADACPECGIRICNSCMVEGLCQKMAHCGACSAELCGSCKHRSCEAAKARIAKLMQGGSNLEERQEAILQPAIEK